MKCSEWIINKIQILLDTDSERYVILPMGGNGRLIKEILEREYQIKNILCLDNMNYDYKTVYPVEREENWNSNYRYIITALDFDIREKLKRQLISHIDADQITELYSDDDIAKWSRMYGKQTLDFLCVGFPKCGTTSLWGVLSQNPNIFLPPTKETFLISDIYNPKAHIRFRNLYEGREEGMLAGGIEPAYFRYAREVNLYFGQGMKVLFCVRNPVEALYSDFKMSMRNLSGNAVCYLEKYGHNFTDAFDEWIEREDNKTVFQYWGNIENYLKYYKKEDIKLVIWEELLEDTERVMDEIQCFIGLAEDKRIQCREMPCLNAGNMMPKNLACAYLNQAMAKMASEQADAAVRTDMIQLWGDIKRITNEEYHGKMSDGAAHKLRVYYRECVEKIGQFAGKNLLDLWSIERD